MIIHDQRIVLASRRTLTSEIRQQTSHSSRKSALIQDGERISYGRLWRDVRDRTRFLTRRGLREGDVVPLPLPHSIDAIVSLLAIWEIRATAVIGEASTVNGRRRDTFPYAPIWIASSGTTGPRKTVRLSWEACHANIRSNVTSLELTEDDTTVMLLPLTYSYGLIGQLLSHMHAGAAIVLPSGRAPRLLDALRILRSERVTTLFLVPDLVRDINTFLAESEIKPLKQNPLRLLTIGGDTIDESHLADVQASFPTTTVAVTYGLVEAGPRVTTGIATAAGARTGFVGSAIPGVSVHVNAPLGRDGDVCVQSPSVMDGYVEDDRLSGFSPRRYVMTGDIGSMGNDGSLHIRGRANQSVATSAGMVYANELKRALYATRKFKRVETTIDDFRTVRISVAPASGSMQPVKAVRQVLAETFDLGSVLVTVRTVGQPRRGGMGHEQRYGSRAESRRASS